MTDVITLDQLKTRGIEPVPEFIWDDPVYLRPAIDYIDGIVYITVPVRRNVPKVEGRGKAAREVVVVEDALVTITSERETFAYTPETLAERGFTMPDTITRPKGRRWSAESIKAFLKGDDTPPDPVTLQHGLRQTYEEYVEFASEEYYDILPLFIMGGYMFRAFGALGYLHFNGTKASGKSRNLALLDVLGFNTEWAANMSAAALYRTIAGFPGVTLIDEAETWDGERREDLRQILNAGYTDGSTVKRAEKGANDMFQVQSFDTFGPKVLASINPLDQVIGSRCLIVLMRPALRKIPEFQRHDARWPRLRDRLYLWAMYHTEAVSALLREWNDTVRFERAPDLLGRQWQITQMYVVLADYLDRLSGDQLCDRLIVFFNDYFAAQQKSEDATDRIRIVLQALPRVLARQAPLEGGFFLLKDIHAVVSDYLEDDAREYYKTRNLAKHLDVLGFRDKKSSKQGTQVRLTPEAIRQEFRQRRVAPQPEDEQWLAGEVEYTHEVFAPSTSTEPGLSVWDDVIEEDEP